MFLFFVLSFCWFYFLGVDVIKYDEYGLIVQHRPDEPDYADGGDSCMKTSIAVISGIVSPMDLGYFTTYNALVVRHPHQVPYCNPDETSRDQLIPFLAACKLYPEFNIRNKFLRTYDFTDIIKNYKYRINKDLLISPSIQWFMRKCSGDDSYSWLGDKALRADILYASKISPEHELNQLMCQCIILGKEYVQLLCKSHPDWRKNLRDYYCGWRDQAELYEAFVNKIEKEL